MWLYLKIGSLADLIKLTRSQDHWKVKVKSFSRVRFFVTPWTVAYQAPLSTGLSRQGYWSGLLFPSPGDLPNPGIKPRSPALQADALPSEPRWLEWALIKYDYSIWLMSVSEGELWAQRQTLTKDVKTQRENTTWKERLELLICRQGVLMVTSTPLGARTRPGRMLVLVSEGVWSCSHFDFALLISWTVK